MSTGRAISIDEAALAQFCLANGIRRLALFGSALTSSFSEESDIDLLVTFEPDANPTLLDMARMEAELTELLGRKADLRTAGELSDYFREAVSSSAEIIFESAPD